MGNVGLKGSNAFRVLGRRHSKDAPLSGTARISTRLPELNSSPRASQSFDSRESPLGLIPFGRGADGGFDLGNQAAV